MHIHIVIKQKLCLSEFEKVIHLIVMITLYVDRLADKAEAEMMRANTMIKAAINTNLSNSQIIFESVNNIRKKETLEFGSAS